MVGESGETKVGAGIEGVVVGVPVNVAVGVVVGDGVSAEIGSGVSVDVGTGLAVLVGVATCVAPGWAQAASSKVVKARIADQCETGCMNPL